MLLGELTVVEAATVSLESAAVERVAELALVFLLFGGSARLDLGALRRESDWPSRLLLIGLPLTMLAGIGGRPHPRDTPRTLQDRKRQQ